MADMTDSPAAAQQHAALPSLASFRELATRRVADEQLDTADVARVAAELLTDARGLRGRHGDAIVVAPAGSAEHELHVNIHACERAALAAQRRGVEALTARLRNDRELLSSITESAVTDLESSARSLLAASSLSDQLLVADAMHDGDPPPPPADYDAAELVVDLTGATADVELRPTDLDDMAAELDEIAETFAATDWEARRTAILDRVEQVRRPEPEPPADEARLSPIVAAALASTPLQPRRPTDELDAERVVDGDNDDTVEVEEDAVDAHDVPDAVDGDVSDVAAELDEPAATVEPIIGDADADADAVVIDIAEAPSVRDASTDVELAEVIELQPEVVAHEWPVWKGPSRTIDSDVVRRPQVAEATMDPVDDVSESAVDSDGYPRLVSVAPDIPEAPLEPEPVEEETPSGKFSFAPEAPTDELLPVPQEPPQIRKTQEEIAEEARELIAGQEAQTESPEAFSRREVRRRQRRLRRHQRAVEKAENRTQRDRRKAEFEHVRALAEEGGETVERSAPTWLAQLLVALIVCLLVVMVAVGVWFLVADDPGLF